MLNCEKYALKMVTKTYSNLPDIDQNLVYFHKFNENVWKNRFSINDPPSQNQFLQPVPQKILKRFCLERLFYFLKKKRVFVPKWGEVIKLCETIVSLCCFRGVSSSYNGFSFLWKRTWIGSNALEMVCKFYEKTLKMNKYGKHATSFRIVSSTKDQSLQNFFLLFSEFTKVTYFQFRGRKSMKQCLKFIFLHEIHQKKFCNQNQAKTSNFWVGAFFLLLRRIFHCER